MGRSYTARFPPGIGWWSVHAGWLQTRGRAPSVRRHYRWTNRQRQSVLLLQLRSAEAQFSRLVDLWSERLPEPELVKPHRAAQSRSDQRADRWHTQFSREHFWSCPAHRRSETFPAEGRLGNQRQEHVDCQL